MTTRKTTMRGTALNLREQLAKSQTELISQYEAAGGDEEARINPHLMKLSALIDENEHELKLSAARLEL